MNNVNFASSSENRAEKQVLIVVISWIKQHLKNRNLSETRKVLSRLKSVAQHIKKRINLL